MAVEIIHDQSPQKNQTKHKPSKYQPVGVDEHIFEVEVDLTGRYTCKIRGIRFPTMWFVRPAKPQISLRIRAV